MEMGTQLFARSVCAVLFAIVGVDVAAQPVVSPSGQVVIQQGTTMRFSANTAVTWSLAPGSAGTIDPDGTYHAPAVFRPAQTYGGCQILPNDHIFNMKVDKLPLHPQSGEWMSRVPGVYRVTYSPEFPTNLHSDATPREQMKFYYTPANNAPYPFLPWPTAMFQTGYFVGYDQPAEADKHYIGVNPSNCEIAETYGKYRPGVNSACPDCTAQSGTIYDSMATTLSGTTDAAGLQLVPLTLRLDELRQREIRHALRFTLANAWIAPSYMWPATANARPWGFIPYGSRLRLRTDFDTSAFSELARVLLRQLKQYGIILSDGGLNFDITTTMDMTMDPAVMAAFTEIRNSVLRSSDFEVVDQSPLRIAANSGQTAVTSQSNPGDYAVVVATSVSNPAQSSRVYLSLKGAAVGVESPAMWIQSGVTKELKAWATGVSNPAIRWTLDQPLGTIDEATGRYTAPEVNEPTRVNAIATSEDTPSATSEIAITVLPAGAIRIDAGSKQTYTDSAGNKWWPDQAYVTSSNTATTETYGVTWPQIPDVKLYQTSRYGLADYTYRFFVPNGNYVVRLLISQGTAIPADTVRPFHIESQGQIVIPSFEMRTAMRGLAAVPVTLMLPATVTDGELYVSLRRLIPYTGDTSKQWPPLLSGLSIEPLTDATPMITINPPDPAVVTIKKKIRFQAIGWYLPSSVRWELEGPGELTEDGTYTAPATPPREAMPVTVRAVSTVNPEITATASFLFGSGDLSIHSPAAMLTRSLTQRFTAAIDGEAYTNVRWEASLGQIAEDGTYTAPEDVAEDTDVVIRAISTDNEEQQGVYPLRVLAMPLPIRIDCGATVPFTDVQGRVWSADFGYSSPSIGYGVNNVTIANATADMQRLYTSARYRYSNQSFYYEFNVPNGSYEVTLMFAGAALDETTTPKAPGFYHMDVAINGTTVVDGNTQPGGAGPGRGWDFDAAAGAPKTAINRKFTVVVRNKVLRIDFTGYAGGALINGMEIIPIAAASSVAQSATMQNASLLNGRI